SLESSLARLRGEMIDCYMLQSVEHPETAQSRVLADAVARAKQEGKIRHAGISTIRNVREVALAAIRSGVFDVVMFPLHPMNLSSMLPLIDEARFKDVGVIGMMSAIALEGHPSVALHELPPGLNAHQLTYMYMLRHTAHAGSVAQMDAMEQLEQNLPVPGIEIGINAGNELDAVVYDELWPQCSVCGAKRAFGEDRLELAYQMRYHGYDLSGLGGDKPGGNWRICENCAAAGERSL
ncbi:aldo/keto reductase, partial [Candidatus Sumerlaeota bacterium]|nr:aldo/keto reductase [Candidatus Sumerlaeota bacterium]